MALVAGEESAAAGGSGEGHRGRWGGGAGHSHGGRVLDLGEDGTHVFVVVVWGQAEVV